MITSEEAKVKILNSLLRDLDIQLHVQQTRPNLESDKSEENTEVLITEIKRYRLQIMKQIGKIREGM